MAAKHKKNTPAHACATTTAPAIQSNDCATFRNISAHTTAQAQNRQPRHSLQYLQTAPNSRQCLTLNSEHYLTRDSERRLLLGIAPPIGSQTATRSEYHLAWDSEHHLARESEHHLRPTQVRINYGLTVGITKCEEMLQLQMRRDNNMKASRTSSNMKAGRVSNNTFPVRFQFFQTIHFPSGSNFLTTCLPLGLE